MIQRIPTIDEFIKEDFSVNSKLKEIADNDIVIKIVARNPSGSLLKMLEHIAGIGNTGHSYEIVVDPDAGKYKKSFGWDGDGPDFIKSIETIKEPVNESYIFESSSSLIDEEKLVNYAKAIEIICNHEYGITYWHKESNKIFICLGDSNPFDTDMLENEFVADAIAKNGYNDAKQISVEIDMECGPNTSMGGWFKFNGKEFKEIK
ncbi:MAG: hypothetical protein WC979_01620 [Candidatus Pacearchaeota archaeon]|jgi:hypothetical protein|nr:hypothetical protein [Clostridia bacterium]